MVDPNIDPGRLSCGRTETRPDLDPLDVAITTDHQAHHASPEPVGTSVASGVDHRRDLPRIQPGTQHGNDPFPLTDIQHAYLIGRHKGLELGGVASHYYLEFEGPELDAARLSGALRRVVERHDMLRAVADRDGTQRILDRIPPYRIVEADLRGRPATEQLAVLAQIRAELSDQVLPTDRCPPLEIRVTQLAGNRTRLHLSADLLFIDIRSLLLMLAEWRRWYDEPTWSPPSLEFSFRDYVLAQQAVDVEQAGGQAREYWLSRLDDLPAAPDLPLAVAPEQLGRPTFTQRRLAFPEPRWAALTTAAARRGLSPAAVLLAAYCEVLRTWSRRQDFTIALSLLDRLPLHPHVGQIMGDFLTPSLLAVVDRSGETFEERVAALQHQYDQDLAHAAFGGIRVLRELTRRQGEGRAASMPVVFTNALGTGGDALGAFGELVHGSSQTPQIWLENQVLERNGGVVLTWNAVERLFPAGLLDEMFQAYRSLLDRLVDDPAVWYRTGRLVSLPFGQDDERRRANATAAQVPPARLHDLVAAAARRTPEAVAVIAEGVEHTYRELSTRANRLARRLRTCGAEPNSLVAVSMRPGADLIAALLGVLHSGAAYVSIDPDLPEQRRMSLLRRCRIRAIVTEADLRERLTWPEDVDLITIDDDATLRCSAEPSESRQQYDDLAYVIFTSGSTGEPKGVMISHRSAANTVQDINRRFGVGSDDRVLALAPTGFDLSVYDIFGVLGAGGAVVIPSPGRSSDVAHWSELIDRYGVTIWNSVPAPMRLWVESFADGAPPAGRTLRLALLSGDWIPTTLPDQIRRHLEMNIVSLGGATEGSIWSVFYPIGAVAPDWPSIPYGKPLANQTLHVYNERLEPCPTWVTGEIFIGGVGVAMGYLADPVRTAERFVIQPATGERLYRTGDLGRYLPGGDIEILGREDSQVKINGYRVELGEIEVALMRQPGVRQTVITAPTHPQTGQRQLTAYLVVAAPDLVDGTVLRKALADVLPSYMVPSHYITIGALPLTTNGKIDYSALPTPWHDGVESAHRVAPRDAVERQLLEIWVEQLGHDDFGVEDGFFDVGGDSLHAVGIISQIRATFDISSAAEQELVEGMFMNSTVADFAKLIDSIETR